MLLRDYALYWSSQANLALNRNAEALAQLQEFRKDYPDSVITDQALQSLGVAALAVNQPAAILAALDGYPQTAGKPALLFLRAEAREQSGQPLQAAADYQTIYFHFPLSDQAREAGQKLSFLRSSLGDKLGAIPIEQQLEHAATIFAAREWGDARNEYSRLLPQLTGADRERAELRIMECGVALGAGIFGNLRAQDQRSRRGCRALQHDRKLLSRPAVGIADDRRGGISGGASARQPLG